MKAPKCETCGTVAMEVWTKTGLRGYICPNTISGGVKSLAGKLRYVEIPCSTEIDGPLAIFMKSTVKALRESVRNTVPTGQLLGHANAGILAEIPAERISRLFAAATALGLATTRTPLESIETLVYGIRNKSPRRLDNISIDMFYKDEEAKRKYPNESPSVAWKLYACDLAEEMAAGLMQ